MFITGHKSPESAVAALVYLTQPFNMHLSLRYVVDILYIHINKELRKDTSRTEIWIFEARTQCLLLIHSSCKSIYKSYQRL